MKNTKPTLFDPQRSQIVSLVLLLIALLGFLISIFLSPPREADLTKTSGIPTRIKRVDYNSSYNTNNHGFTPSQVPRKTHFNIGDITLSLNEKLANFPALDAAIRKGEPISVGISAKPIDIFHLFSGETRLYTLDTNGNKLLTYQDSIDLLLPSWILEFILFTISAVALLWHRNCRKTNLANKTLHPTAHRG
ncbi:hypothetical protein ACFPK9_00670 [Rubritalea spongiae]|uniref:Uncharacterized protein n=1 Tax=Rubritalea spongiae TaxID=430797 RepID=A0ABW5E7S5_9BACT